MHKTPSGSGIADDGPSFVGFPPPRSRTPNSAFSGIPLTPSTAAAAADHGNGGSNGLGGPSVASPTVAAAHASSTSPIGLRKYVTAPEFVSGGSQSHPEPSTPIDEPATAASPQSRRLNPHAVVWNAGQSMVGGRGPMDMPVAGYQSMGYPGGGAVFYPGVGYGPAMSIPMMHGLAPDMGHMAPHGVMPVMSGPFGGPRHPYAAAAMFPGPSGYGDPVYYGDGGGYARQSPLWVPHDDRGGGSFGGGSSSSIGSGGRGGMDPRIPPSRQ